MTENT